MVVVPLCVLFSLKTQKGQWNVMESNVMEDPRCRLAHSEPGGDISRA